MYPAPFKLAPFKLLESWLLLYDVLVVPLSSLFTDNERDDVWYTQREAAGMTSSRLLCYVSLEK